MQEIVPTISSSTVGPLGVRHLPRLWLKTLLKAYDRLPEGYKDIRPGYDYMALEGLKVDPEAAREFILTAKPDYPRFEQWIREQPGVDLSPENIARLNADIESREKSDESRADILERCGLPNDGVLRGSTILNDLDDWRELHSQLGT